MNKEKAINYINREVMKLVTNHDSSGDGFERIKRMVIDGIDVKVELNKNKFYAIVKENNKNKVEFNNLDEFINYSY